MSFFRQKRQLHKRPYRQLWCLTSLLLSVGYFCVCVSWILVETFMWNAPEEFLLKIGPRLTVLIARFVGRRITNTKVVSPIPSFGGYVCAANKQTKLFSTSFYVDTRPAKNGVVLVMTLTAFIQCHVQLTHCWNGAKERNKQNNISIASRFYIHVLMYITL